MRSKAGIVTFTCPSCGQERSGLRRRCYACTGFKQTPESIEKIRRTMTGQKHPPERVQKNSDSHKGLTYVMRPNDPRLIAGWNRQPIGYVRLNVGKNRYQVKCADGKWRYQARVMWEEANGPIPHGHVVHHVNHNQLDDRLENFQLLTNGDHVRHHADPERNRAAQLLGVAARKRNAAARGHY